MKILNRKDCKHVILESELNDKFSDYLLTDEQIIQYQEKTSIQKKLIAEQAMQIYWLIAELRGRDAEIAA